jgi:hypothetical protein
MSRLVKIVWYDLIQFLKHVQTCWNTMIRFDTILQTCPDLSKWFETILKTCWDLSKTKRWWNTMKYYEILKNLSEWQTKWHTTTKLFLGPLSTSERSKRQTYTLFWIAPIGCIFYSFLDFGKTLKDMNDNSLWLIRKTWQNVLFKAACW